MLTRSIEGDFTEAMEGGEEIAVEVERSKEEVTGK